MTFPLRLCVHRTPASPEVPATRVAVRVPSDVECIEEAVRLVTHHCVAGTAATSRTKFRLQVALAEALANAIIRGNHEDIAKSVDVQVDILADAIEIRVTDEGEGFDPHAVPDPVDADRVEDASGRGLFLIRRLVDAVDFNERGNSIRMIIRDPA